MSKPIQVRLRATTAPTLEQSSAPTQYYTPPSSYTPSIASSTTYVSPPPAKTKPTWNPFTRRKGTTGTAAPSSVGRHPAGIKAEMLDPENQAWV